MNTSFEMIILFVVSGVFFFLLLVIVWALISVFMKRKAQHRERENEPEHDEF
jgi:hypothetical protein